MPNHNNRLLLKELPHEERPRERLIQQGAVALSNAELIAITLRTGRANENVLELATHLLAKFDGLSGLSRASIQQLAETPGIGPAKAAELLAAMELGKRIGQLNGEGRLQVTSPEDAAKFFQARLSGEQQETLYVMHVDTKHRSFRSIPVYIGNVSAVIVRPAEVFREAIKDNATAIIVAHNHPSGDPSPSPEDINFTKEIKHLGQQLGIELLDHIVVGHNTYYSMKQHGIILS
ncbi:MAG: DNA repair protein RadC [Chloroflexi bacterium]|nr:DNA repair protein RadC [Chloroflexota bacterium]